MKEQRTRELDAVAQTTDDKHPPQVGALEVSKTERAVARRCT